MGVVTYSHTLTLSLWKSLQEIMPAGSMAKHAEPFPSSWCSTIITLNCRLSWFSPWAMIRCVKGVLGEHLSCSSAMLNLLCSDGAVEWIHHIHISVKHEKNFKMQFYILLWQINTFDRNKYILQYLNKCKIHFDLICMLRHEKWLIESSSARSDKQVIKVRVSDQTLSLMFNRCIHFKIKVVVVVLFNTFSI